MNSKLTALTLLAWLLLLVSCGTKEEAVKEAMLEANFYLNNSNCQDAIDILESQGDQSTDGRFLQILASAYACRAGFKETRFFVNDLPNFSEPQILGGSTTFTTSSSMNAPDNDQYEDLQRAINILLYAGGLSTSKDPTVARRAAVLPADIALDVNAQLLYMVMAQIGKFLYYYGNANASGIKGAGTQTNKCILTYDDTISVNVSLSGLPAAAVPLGTYLDTATGSTGIGACNSSQIGHPQLGADGGETPLKYDRLCQGAVLINNFLEIFPAVLEASTGGDFAAVSGVLTQIEAVIAIVEGAKTGMESIVGVLSQEKCETNNTDDNPANVQIYYALLMENLFK